MMQEREQACRRFLRRASLHRVPFIDGFVFENLILPAPRPDHGEIAALAGAAIRVAGFRVPSEVVVAIERDTTHEGEERAIHRTWDIAFEHAGVRVAPARCRLAVEADRVQPATLDCRLPPGTLPLRFDVFSIDDAGALATAAALTGVAPLRSDISRLYHVRDGVRAEARIHVVHFDGTREMLTVLDGAGHPISAGSNEKPYTFRGYDLDYSSGLTELEAPVAVAPGQTTVLDSIEAEPGRVSCLHLADPDLPLEDQLYDRGFALCRNDMLLEGFEPNQYVQLLVAPRSDDNYLNAANAPAPIPDPLGPQIIVTNGDLSGAPAAHGNRFDLTSWPRQPTQLESYLREKLADEQPIGPAHHAELQLFFATGKLSRAYAPIDFRFSAAGSQDRFRTEVAAHWKPRVDDPGKDELDAGGRAGRFLIKIADWRLGTGHVLDGTTDGSIVAHEFHHHIQESLAVDEGWALIPSDEDVLFPEDGKPCQPDPDCGRRNRLLEGLADGHASIAVRRGVIGTIAAPGETLGTLHSACNDNGAYLDGRAFPGPRLMCNRQVFGYWQEVVPDGVTPPDCFANESDFFAHDRFGPNRQLVIGAAAWRYQKRFLDAGFGPLVPQRHLIEAERSLSDLTDGEPVFGHGLTTYLRGTGIAAVMRYEYPARAALLEKGVFPALIHFFAAGGLGGGNPDAKPFVACDAPCTNESARTLSGLTLTLAGPFHWDGDPATSDTPPEFDAYAVPGDRYVEQDTVLGTANVVFVDFSDNAAFDPGQGETRRFTRNFLRAPRLNCSPPGFFRFTNTTEWRAVAESALDAEERVYYRMWQCLAGSQPPALGSGASGEPNCVVSTLPGVPAYVRLAPRGAGCECTVPARPSGSAGGLAGLLGLLGIAWLYRRRR